MAKPTKAKAKVETPEPVVMGKDANLEGDKEAAVPKEIDMGNGTTKVNN